MGGNTCSAGGVWPDPDHRGRNPVRAHSAACTRGSSSQCCSQLEKPTALQRSSCVQHLFPIPGCSHNEMSGMHGRRPFPELQSTTGARWSQPSTPASASATTSCKEPACETQSRQAGRVAAIDRERAVGTGRSLSQVTLQQKPFSPKEDLEPSLDLLTELQNALG